MTNNDMIAFLRDQGDTYRAYSEGYVKFHRAADMVGKAEIMANCLESCARSLDLLGSQACLPIIAVEMKNAAREYRGTLVDE